jgi:two-component system, NarL family, invasion response regulator UvrY
MRIRPARRPYESLRVMVVDDHARVRHGLCIFLSTCSGIEVVADAGSGVEALERFEETCPDVVIMDLTTPGMDSPVITSRMKELSPSTRIIALSSHNDPGLEQRALEAGATCCVVKESSTAALVEAVRPAHGGRLESVAHMMFVQEETGISTERESRAITDGRGDGSDYDGVVNPNGKSATEEVETTAR